MLNMLPSQLAESPERREEETMIPADRVAKPGQWRVSVATDEEQRQQVQLAFSDFPGMLAFRLSPEEALQFSEVLTALVKQYIDEGIAGPVKVVVTDYRVPPRSRVLQLQFNGPFPGECYGLLTDIAAKGLAAELNTVAQGLLEKNQP